MPTTLTTTPRMSRDHVEDARMRGMQDVYTAISIEEAVQFQVYDLRSIFNPLLYPHQPWYGGYLSQGWVDTGLEIRGSKSEFLLWASFGGGYCHRISRWCGRRRTKDLPKHRPPLGSCTTSV